MKLKLKTINGDFAICYLDPKAQIPLWSRNDLFYSLTMTKDELSIVTLQAQVPKGIKCDPFWNILMVIGPLDFSLVGVLADISKVLKAAEISIFVISTYETDYILVKKDNLQKAITVLNNSGYEVLC